MKATALIFVSFFLSTLVLGAEIPSNSIIPEPANFTPLTGTFSLSQQTRYYSDTPLSHNAVAYLQEHLQTSSEYTLHTVQTPVHNSITFKMTDTIAKEAYRLHITTEKVTISAGSSAGFFYGIITLMQLMDVSIWSQDQHAVPIKKWAIQACYIEDSPRFHWRGMMLDSARNFFSVAYVKKFIDRMAQHKLNVFHWHLTDDEGWRIEIKKYPLLTQVGAKRGPGTDLPFSLYPTMRGPKDKIQEGFYTQDEIREVVAYAAARSVNILPEIDVPAHAKAAVMSYPALLQDPNDTSNYQSVQKVSNNTMDPSLESTYLFLDNVIEELTILFPFEYIHLGGDEVPKGAWKGSPSVKRLMREHKLKNSSEVQNYFFTKVDTILAKHQRKLMGWQEIRRPKSELRDTTVIMAWRGDDAAKKAVNAAQNVILSPAQFLYFDQQYLRAKNEFGHTWAGPTDTKEVYSYQPLQSIHPHKKSQYLLGVHACLWSETALNEQIADYLVWPRALALSELAWSSKKSHNWNNFKQRVETGGLERLHVQKINFRQKKL